MPGDADDKNKGGEGDQSKGEQDGKSTAPTWEDWLKEQADDVKSLAETHTKGLRSALDSEREQRKTIQKELRDAAKKLEEGSEAQKSVVDMADKLSKLEKQADFYDAAHKAGANDLALAFMAAEKYDLFDRKGNVDFDQMKKQFPALFVPDGGSKPPPLNAGNGTRSNTTSGKDFNSMIREAAGRS